MTVIAWDGKTLAADRQSTNNGIARTAQKIFRWNGNLVGFCGDASHAAAMLQWFMAGFRPGEMPKAPNSEDYANALIIQSDGAIQIIYGLGNGYPETILDETIALGSGRDFAMAAMYLGCDAKRAVEVACSLEINCGQGIDVLTLQE